MLLGVWTKRLASSTCILAGDADALRGPRKPVGETGCYLVRGQVVRLACFFCCLYDLLDSLNTRNSLYLSYVI